MSEDTAVDVFAGYVDDTTDAVTGDFIDHKLIGDNFWSRCGCLT